MAMTYEEISNSNRLSNSEKRSLRLRLAKEKGDHKKEEWEEMKRFFDGMCACCLGESGNFYIVKDHIIPIYQGGSNSIRNLQPLCDKCNCSKGPNSSDWRPQLADHLGKDLPELYTNPF